MLNQKIKESGSLSKSDYLRKMALNGYIIKPNYELSKELVYQLQKIGTNLNQIAMKINSTDDINLWRKELAKWGKELDDLWQLHILRGEVKEKTKQQKQL